MMTGIPCVKTFLTNFYQHFKSLMVLEPAWARRHHHCCGTFEIYQIWNNNLFCRARCWWRNQLYLQLHNTVLGSAMVAGLILNIVILFIIPQKLKIYLKNSFPDCVPLALFQVQLRSQASIESVAVTINSDGFQHFTIFVIELLHGNKALYKPCSKFEVI